MRWTWNERHTFMGLWAEEDPPKGWRRAREWLADRCGHDRALRRWSLVVVGGDATLATLAMRAHARTNPCGDALWVPDAHWAKAPFVWTAGEDVVETWHARLGLPRYATLGGALNALRTDARARLTQGGGTWARCERRLFDAAADNGRVCVLKPRGVMGPAPSPQTVAEEHVAQWWGEAVSDAPLWRANGASMVGGVADEVWVLQGDLARPGWKKEPFVRDFSLAVSPETPISMACSQWWEAADALIGLARQVPPDGDEKDDKG